MVLRLTHVASALVALLVQEIVTYSVQLLNGRFLLR